MKSLVVYFLVQGKLRGNTEIVDEEISKLTGADNQLMLILITIKSVVM